MKRRYLNVEKHEKISYRKRPYVLMEYPTNLKNVVDFIRAIEREIANIGLQGFFELGIERTEMKNHF